MSTIKRIWHFIWEEDSFASWIVNIIIAFVLVKFVIYPGLGFVLGTTHPVVAVMSSSMAHSGDFESWWQWQGNIYMAMGITKEYAESWRFKNGFDKGDIMVVRGVKPDDLKIGDVLIFYGKLNEPIIHRIVLTDISDGEPVFTTKGDNNNAVSDQLGERNIKKGRIVGKAVFQIPLLGWVKIIFMDVVNSFKR